MNDTRSYDTIIVGAGSAGCVLAYRLSENPDHTVLLIEAGPDDRNPYIHIPKGFGKTLQDPRLTWCFPTEPEPGNAQRAFTWLRGKALGGSSAVNGMIYVRGHPADYDGWEALGNPGWGWRDMLRSYREMENHELGADEFRGAGGPLNISIQKNDSPLIEALLAAGQAMGLPRREDLNRPEVEGIGLTPATIWKGRRVSAARAFITPVRHRANLDIVTDTTIHRVLFNGKRAVGVAGSRRGQAVEYRAHHEIIVAAGALHSPKILQLSGVGPSEQLKPLGIEMIHHLPGVGQNLREHKLLMLQWRLKQPLSINPEMAGWRLYKNVLTWFLWRRGPLATTYDLNAFLRSCPNLDRPDIQLTLSAFSLDLSKEDGSLERQHGINIFGYPTHPRSQGSVMIRSANPDDFPFIRANHLIAEEDRQTTVAMTRFIRKLAAQPMLTPYLGEETSPGASVQSDEEIIAACAASNCGAHAVGTCKMGSDPLAVVDPRLRVHGIDGLRVVDCSVMPTQITGNTNGPVMALAWRAANLILEDRP